MPSACHPRKLPRQLWLVGGMLQMVIGLAWLLGGPLAALGLIGGSASAAWLGLKRNPIRSGVKGMH